VAHLRHGVQSLPVVRDLRRLADSRFDVLVIGAGIYGVATAWDAAQRGLSVALIDRGDIGGGTSFHNLKTLHGGLRSLQAMNPRQMRRFIRERRALVRIAPHLVRPLPFIVPTTSRLMRSTSIMRVALALNDAAAHDRSDGIADPELHLPGSAVVTREEAWRLNPFVDRTTVTGGAIWYDYQMTNADRMTLAFAQSAAHAGAVIGTYVSARAFLVEHGRVTGARVQDERSGAGFGVHARVVVNAAGAWAPDLVRTLPSGASAVPAPLLSRAMNVIVDVPPHSHACGGTVDGRFLFLVPWRDVSILGTSHDVHAGPADALRVTDADLTSFLAEGRRAFPQARLTREHVRLVHRGLLPMVSNHGREVHLLRESAVVDHAAHGSPGLVTLHGVRYTTARHTASDAVDTVFRVLGHSTPPACRTDTTTLHGGAIPRVSALVDTAARERPDVPVSVITRIVRTYGTDYARLLALAQREPHLAAPLGMRCAVTALEIAWAVREEMAVTLADALIRRTEAGSAGHPGADAVAQAAEVMATELGWDATRRANEMAAVEAFYRLET
jgi:glycerol-3-phosphate dehydrogenase